ncbi:MAG: glycosyltransferase family 2 protein [Nitrospirota bacterium]
MSNALPFVTIILPCRNEEKFIAGCLDSIISSDYPKDRLEALVVDGMSEDGTRKILAGYMDRYEFIRVIENEKKITPSAFNLGIKNACGDIIMIMGMHAAYAGDYISKSVKYLDEYGADNVGGVMITMPRKNTLTGNAIAQALSHKFGVGNSTFRAGTAKPVFVDTVFGGCYRKEVFERIGLFNERLVRSQDIEFNLRLSKSGGRILLMPDIVCLYYAHSDFMHLLRHNWTNGVWAMLPLADSPIMPVSWRHFVPLTFISTLICSALFSLFLPVFAKLLLLVSTSYFLATIYFSYKISLHRKDVRLLFIEPMVFASLHISYGLGSLWGVGRLLILKRFWTDRVFKNL